MKKLISLIMCAVLTACIFAGCSKKEAENEPEKKDISIAYIADAHNSSVNQSVFRAFEQLCDAVVNGKEQALFNISLLGDVNRLFYSDFPLSYLVNKLEINSDNSGVKIIYEKELQEHLKAVEEFKIKVNQILDDCGCGKVSNNVFVLNLYSYLTKNTKLSSQCNYTYDVIVNSIGYSFSIAGAFTYLLNQAGIKASAVNSTNENGICFMTETEFQGGTYIFIPYLEAKENSGNALCYFALDYTELVNLGFNDVKYTDSSGVAFDDYEQTYNDLRDSVAYILEGSNLSVTKNNGEIVQFAL